MVMSAAQTGLKPTTVTCEMRICGDWTGLNASVKLLSRACLRRMWEAWHCWGGGQNQPVCPVFSESRQLLDQQPAKITYPRGDQWRPEQYINYNVCLAFRHCIHISVGFHRQKKNVAKICQMCHLRRVFIVNIDLTRCPLYALYHWW